MSCGGKQAAPISAPSTTPTPRAAITTATPVPSPINAPAPTPASTIPAPTANSTSATGSTSRLVANPTIVGALDTPGIAFDVFVSNNLAFVADRAGGLRVVDVTDPTAPVEVGALETPARHHGPDQVFDVFVFGDLAFISTSSPEGFESELRIVDVSNPLAPAVVGALSDVRSVADVFISGRLAYVAYASGPVGPDRHDGGLRIVDVSNATALKDVGSLDFSGAGSGSAVFVSGDLAFVA